MAIKDYEGMSLAEWQNEMVDDLRSCVEIYLPDESTDRPSSIKAILESTYGAAFATVLRILLDTDKQHEVSPGEAAKLQRAMMLLPFVGDKVRMQEIKDEMENPTPIL